MQAATGLLQKLTVSKLRKNFPPSYQNHVFSTVSTTAATFPYPPIELVAFFLCNPYEYVKFYSEPH